MRYGWGKMRRYEGKITEGIGGSVEPVGKGLLLSSPGWA